MMILLYDKLLSLGSSYKEKVSSAEVTQLMTEGVDQLETYFGLYLSQLFYALIAPVILFIVTCFISIRAAVILLVFVPLIPISIVVVQKIAKRLLNRYWSMYASLGDSFLDNIQGLTTLKIYQSDQYAANKMDAESEHFRNVTMKVLTMQLNSTSVMDIMAYGGAAAGIIVSLSEYSQNSITLSGALTIILLAAEFFLPMRRLGSYFHIAMNGMAASDKIFKLLDLEVPAEGEEDFPEDADCITFDKVFFPMIKILMIKKLMIKIAVIEILVLKMIVIKKPVIKKLVIKKLVIKKLVIKKLQVLEKFLSQIQRCHPLIILMI